MSIKHQRLWKLALTAFMLFAATWLNRAGADSLYPVKEAGKSTQGSSSSSAASLFSDTRAHNVGDILTVTIAENTTAQSTADLKTSKDESINGFSGTGLFDRLFRQLSLTASNSRTANGSGSTSRTGSLVTTLSVIVKEVLPNGTLRIEGTRTVGINKETQKVTFSGIVRPEDIATDNSVPSNLIATVEVHYDGKGSVAETQKPGILTRIFKYVF
ncbi:MAG TPA: flagellar basal body L-ring protein FlgH [Chthonomonadaceae bacterium]|nr:flagellar basal body L-ring protein FlgH [Chthonomonadaceae bacterium]